MVSTAQLSPDQVAAAVAAGKLAPGTTSATQYQNVAEIRDIGLDAAYDGSRLGGHLRYGVNITVADAQRNGPDGNNADLTVSPKVFGKRARLVRASGSSTFRVIGLAALFFGERLADRANDGMFTPTRPGAGPGRGAAHLVGRRPRHCRPVLPRDHRRRSRQPKSLRRRSPAGGDAGSPERRAVAGRPLPRRRRSLVPLRQVARRRRARLSAP